MRVTLILKDGTTFEGTAFGAHVSASGEAVFNTGMVGYPESMTDPSYAGQILVCTYPLIGNYGVPPDRKDQFGLERHFESSRIHIKALVVGSYTAEYSHWEATRSLGDWMKAHSIPGITGVDTRAITHYLRDHGSTLAKLVMEGTSPADVGMDDPNRRNLVAEVSTTEVVTYGEERTILGRKKKKRVVLVDCGVKNNIIRSLLVRGVEVVRVPWDYDFLNGDLAFDGILLSNGPGDPKACTSTVAHIRAAMERSIPILGICLGNQLVALAAGGDTYKLPYGHRSQNQPCVDLRTKRCYVTSQNHGFAVNMKKMPRGWETWFVNANDDTHEGMRHTRKPFLTAQFHPEATPGPTDTAWIFDEFIGLL